MSEIQKYGMVDPVVTNLVIGLPLDQTLIAEQVLPPVEVEAEDFLIRLWGQEAREELNDDDAIIGPDGAAKRSTFTTSMQRDHLEEWGREAAYGYRLKAASLRQRGTAAYVDLDTQFAGGIKSQTWLLKEKQTATVVNDDDNIIEDALFDNVDFADQGIDLYTILMKAKEERQKQSAPLKLFQFGVAAWRLFKMHKSITGLLSANERKNPTRDVVANLIEVPQILVGEATVGIGASARYIWDPNRCTLLYSNMDAPNKLNPSFGYTYWTKHILTTPDGREMFPDLAAATGADGLGTREVVYSYRDGWQRVVGYRFFSLPRVAFKDAAIAFKNVNPTNK